MRLIQKYELNTSGFRIEVAGVDVPLFSLIMIILIAQGEWVFKPDEIITLIEGLDANNRILELEWKCPGRRGPSPVPSNNHQQDHNLQDYK